MASISAIGSKGHHKFTLTVKEKSDSVDVAANTSDLSYSFKLSPVQTSWDWSGWSDKIEYSIKIAGKTITGTIPSYDGSSTVTLKSGTIKDVAHDSNGSKTISYSFTVTDNAGQSYTPGNASAKDTLKLTTIPRASSFDSISKAVIGSSVTVKIDRKSTDFDHRMYYRVGDTEWYRVGLHVETEATFTINKETAKQIPTSTTGKMELCLKTYNGSTQIGENVYKEVTVYVPDYKPTASKPTLTGKNLLSGEYVQGKSSVTVETMASTFYGADIKSYSATIDGKTYTGSKFTAAVLNSGDKTIKVKVTDTRGKYVEVTADKFTVHKYFAPIIKNVSLERKKDTDGNETIIEAKVLGEIAAVNQKNIVNLSGFNVSLSGGEPIRCENVTSIYSADTETFIVEGTATFTGTSTDATYIAIATLTDYYNIPVTMESVLPTVDVTMDFHHSGKGVAFGKVAEEENLLEVKWNVKVHGKLLDADDNDLFYDSGWRNVDYNEAYFGDYATSQQVKYRRVGKQVYIRGSIKPKQTIATSSGPTLFTLPEGFRPSQAEHFLCTGASSNTWLCTVKSAGDVTVSDYTSSSGNVSENSRLTLSVSFLVG